MAGTPDKYYDLAVVDPPYGINITRQGLGEGGGLYRQPKKYKRGDWDGSVPSEEYFSELQRVSKNQIIWGGNYFDLPPTPCYLFWDKNNGGSDFADGELAWCSFTSPVRKFKYTWSGFIQQKMGDAKEERLHPTQKPVALYDWIFKNYLPNGGKVLDTHVGSGSSRISAYKRGNIDFTGYEIDPDYWADQEARFREFVMKHAPASLEPITRDGQFKLF